MAVIECSQHTRIGGQSSNDDEDVKDLMRGEEEVEFARGKSLWNSICTTVDQDK